MLEEPGKAAGTNVENDTSDQLLPAERHMRIRHLLRERLTIRVAELSEMMGVSEMTIRRDLETLERQGLIERTYGGAVYRQDHTSREEPYETRLRERPDIRDQIGRKAASLIEPHDTLFLHSGTTALYVLRHLDPDMPVRVYTNNVGAIQEIRGKRAELVLLGGEYRCETHSVEGPLTMETMQELHPKKSFLIPDGISLRDGITTSSFTEAALERAMIQQTRGQVIVLATHGSFGRIADLVVAAIEKVDLLVVDHKLPEEYLRDLKALGIRVLAAD
jgi:DeoR/GlpR family transcriptional regulator of sugar metabolism